MVDSIARPSNILEIMRYTAFILHYKTLLPNDKHTIMMLFELMGATHEPFVLNDTKPIVFESLFH